MAIRIGEIITVDTLAEKDATPTDTAIELLICKDDGYLYRKVPDELGGWIWGRKSTMSTSVYDINNSGVVDNAERLGNQLPGFYASASSLTTKADLVNGIVPTSQLPAMTPGNLLGNIASQAAMLAKTQSLIGQPIAVGDFGVRTDTNQICILGALPASTLGNWIFQDAPAGQVLSVNGQTGAIVLGKTDLGLGNVDNTSDVNKPVSTAQAAANTTALNAGKAYTDSVFAGLSTTNVPEGVNLYFTNTRADARIAAAGLATTASINLQNSAVPTWQRLFTGQVSTTDATLTPIFTSGVIPDGTSIWVDCTIHAQYASGQGQAVLSMQGVVQKTAGGNIRMPQAVRLQSTGDLGLAIATCSVTLNTAQSRYIVNVQGKSATSIKWAAKIEINQFVLT